MLETEPYKNCINKFLNINLSLSKNNINLNYSIHIKLNGETIQLSAYETEELKKYSKKLTLEDFYSLDKNFRAYDSLSEIFDFLKKSRNKNGISIKVDDTEEEDNDLNLLISLFNIDNTKVCIKLTEKELTKSELMNQTISSLKIKVKNLENKIMEISEKHNNDIEELKKLIDDIKKENKETEKKQENNRKTINDFIPNYSDLTFIENEIIRQIGKKIKSYNLIYKPSVDGERASDFHRKCDEANNNLSIIKTKKGRVFGGFTTQNWKSSSSGGLFKYDANAFVFSVNNKKIYRIKDKDKAIYCRTDLALFFSDTADIYIYDNCFSSQGGTNQSAYEYNGELYALNGEARFNIEDYEVYKVEFE